MFGQQFANWLNNTNHVKYDMLHGIYDRSPPLHKKEENPSLTLYYPFPPLGGILKCPLTVSL